MKSACFDLLEIDIPWVEFLRALQQSADGCPQCGPDFGTGLGEGDIGPLAAIAGPLRQTGSVRIAVHDEVDPVALQQGAYPVHADIERPIIEDEREIRAMVDAQLTGCGPFHLKAPDGLT